MNKSKFKYLIWDLDDSLLECQYNYSVVLSRFAMEMVNHFGTKCPPPKDVLEYQSIADGELLKSLGYKKNRFPQSFVETYKHFHKLYIGNENYDEKAIEKFRELGETVFDIIPRPIKNAFNILARLRADGVRMAILTAGEQDVQAYKIKHNSWITEFIRPEDIFIRIDKTGVEFEEVHKHFSTVYEEVIPKESICMIGDSKRSDINPSLGYGINAIHIDTNTWSYGDVPVDEKYEYDIVKNLYELEALLFAEEVRDGHTHEEITRLLACNA